MRIIDLSFSIDNETPSCGTSWHQNVNIMQMGTIESVGRNTHSILLGSHTATHMDAPLHFIDNGRSVDSLDLDILCGDVKVVDFSHLKAGSVVSLIMIKKMEVTKRMLFRFDWFKKWKTTDYYIDFPCFSEDAIRYLMDNGLKLLALDTPSPDSGININSKNDSPNHKILLSNDVVIIEYLNNTDLISKDKEYQIIALPIKVKGCDGAPSRVILIEKNSL
jgi:arylformamidase